MNMIRDEHCCICRLMGLALGPQLPALDVKRVAAITVMIMYPMYAVMPSVLSHCAAQMQAA